MYNLNLEYPIRTFHMFQFRWKFIQQSIAEAKVRRNVTKFDV